MEELNTKPIAASSNETKERKPYTPPTADIILLVPKEELSAWDYTYHGSTRWALNGWNDSFDHNTASGGMEGTVYNPYVSEDNNWTLTK